MVTRCETHMGPPIVDFFRAEGADVIADTNALLGADGPTALIERVGEVEALVANLDLPAYGAPVRDIEDAE